MVSSAVGMTKQEVVRALARIARAHRDDADYKTLRKVFPRSWPM